MKKRISYYLIHTFWFDHCRYSATYIGTTYEFRAKLKVCEEHYKPYIKKIEKCKKAARFGNLGN